MSHDLATSIKSKLYDFRGYRVMLDSDLADYYGVKTSRLNEAVKRNLHRFPEDFMFQLNDDEFNLLSQNATSSSHGGRRNNPYVFTEKGAWTISFILKSDEAAERGIQLIRALEKLRDFAQTKIPEITGATQHLLTSPTSIVNHFHGNVNIQQGSHNQLVMNQAELILELAKIKSVDLNPGMQEKLDLIIQTVGKNDKPGAMKLIKNITDSAKAGSTVYKLGTELGTLLGPWIHDLAQKF
jgi:hypothetical protein